MELRSFSGRRINLAIHRRSGVSRQAHIMDIVSREIKGKGRMERELRPLCVPGALVTSCSRTSRDRYRGKLPLSHGEFEKSHCARACCCENEALLLRPILYAVRDIAIRKLCSMSSTASRPSSITFGSLTINVIYAEKETRLVRPNVW